MSWLVDAHVHYQECFGWGPFLEGAKENLRRTASELPENSVQAGCLLFVDVAGTSSREQLLSFWEEAGGRALQSDGWALRSLPEIVSLALRPPEGPELLLAFGRQIATREGLEVLSVGPAAAPPDRLEFEETVRASLGGDALTVIPWGFGKWWLGRGRRVARLLDGDLAQRIHLGDNGNRLSFGPEPDLLREARRRRIPILPGSDPLPMPHHARRALSYGFRIEGTLDEGRPAASLRSALDERPTDLPVFGRRAGPFRFVTDQLRMQWQARRRSPRSPQEPGGSGSEAS